jgi:ApbE superfamily uncharacterized protein (UPF0280 family)
LIESSIKGIVATTSVLKYKSLCQHCIINGITGIFKVRIGRQIHVDIYGKSIIRADMGFIVKTRITAGKRRGAIVQ